MSSVVKEPADFKIWVWHHTNMRTWISGGFRFKISRKAKNEFLLEDLRWPRRKPKKAATLNEAKQKADSILQLEGAV